MKLALKYISNSKKGLKREKNQDRVLIIDEDSFYIFIIFDGVSSYTNSYLFVNEFREALKSKVKLLDRHGNNLDRILYETHQEVLTKEINGKSTITLLFISKETNTAKFVNIGDSRIYIYTNQFLEKVTADDSLTTQKNIITRYLGKDSMQQYDFRPKIISTKYNYLLCTDGFYEVMEENIKEYFRAFNFKRLHNIKKKLSQLQAKKNTDDSTYIVIKNDEI